MKGDFTRPTFDRSRHYSGVRMQQGRVQLDSDWNEQIDIQAHRAETETRDVIGPGGAPLGADGFRLAASAAGLTAEEQARPGNQAPPALAGPGDFLITSGRCYAGGWLAENESIASFAAQPDLPAPPLPALPGTYFGYLDLWQRHLTALEDPAIREVALGGPDTATRSKTVWQVRLVRVGDAADPLHCLSEPAAWTAAIAPPTGRLAARAEPGEAPGDPCIVPAGAGFRRLENQLYRVEVHHGGNRGAATFKWSRDNGSLVSRWETQNGADITVSSAGRDKQLSFAAGQWVELSDSFRELRGEPGTLVRIAAVDGLVLTLDLPTADGPTARAGFGSDARVRRWDGAGVLQPNSGAWMDLEDGVQVRVTAGTYRTGDYWTIPARTNTGAIEWPVEGGIPAELAPRGIEHRYCRLAVMRFDGAAWTAVLDCRKLFPPITELESFFFLGGDGQEALPGAELDQPLRAGAARGRFPVAGARVRFRRLTPAGELLPGGGSEESGSASQRIVLTNAEGVAEVRLRLGAAGAGVTHVVEAEMLDVAGGDLHLPVRYTARLSLASQVAYDPGACTALAGTATVQQALDTLAAQAILVLAGGDGQPIRDGQPLERPVEIAVVSACGPVAGASVRFSPQGAGRVAPTAAELPGMPGPLTLQTDAQGLARVAWFPDPDLSIRYQELTVELLAAGGRSLRAPARVIASAIRACSRCHDFLDDLRSDGVVRRPATAELGLAVSAAPGGILAVDYTGGIAYVGGCRFEIAPGRVPLEPGSTPHFIIVDPDGQVRAVAKGPFPTAFALLAQVEQFANQITRLIDRRRDMTHLDERLESLEAEVAARRPDRRAGIPLLALTLPNLDYRDLRNRSFAVANPSGLAFDGRNIWIGGIGENVHRIARDANSSEAPEAVPIGIPTTFAAYDGESHVWFASTVRRTPGGGFTINNQVVALDLTTRAVRVLTAGRAPITLAVAHGRMWAANALSSSLTAFDLATHRVVFTVALVSGTQLFQPRALAFDGQNLWVGCIPGALFRVNASGNATRVAIELPEQVTALAFDGANLWVSTNTGSGLGPVFRIDTLSESLVPTPSIQGSLMVCDGSRMWLVESQPSTNAVTFRSRDCATASPAGETTVVQPGAVAFDGSHIWMTQLATQTSAGSVRKFLAV